MKPMKSLKSVLLELEADDREVAGQISEGSADHEAYLRLRREHAKALSSGRTDGYLLFPEEGSLSLQFSYLSERESQGRAGVILYPFTESEWGILATCFSQGPFNQLLQAAKRVGVTISSEQRVSGFLSGAVEKSRAHEVAKHLVALPFRPESAAEFSR